MVRSVFVSHNNKGRQRVYIDSHYLDNIDNNAVIINVHLCSHSEQTCHNLYQGHLKLKPVSNSTRPNMSELRSKGNNTRMEYE
jgi:hypothetical protein